MQIIIRMSCRLAQSRGFMKGQLHNTTVCLSALDFFTTARQVRSYRYLLLIEFNIINLRLSSSQCFIQITGKHLYIYKYPFCLTQQRLSYLG